MNTDNHNALQKKQQEYLVQSNPSSYSPPVSLADAAARCQKPISVIRKSKYDELLTWVKGRIIQVFTYLGCFDKAKDFQVIMLAKRICGKYYFLTTAELDYFFIAFADGEYRKVYNGNNVNPQDIMASLVDYERDVLVARNEAERKRQHREEARKRAEDAKKPHGREAWYLYCRKNGLDPEKHKLPTYTPKNINKAQ